ncbi:MAG: ribosome-associated translation inhibitor RaiA [Planctomycetes bacterium]|nr:ribosome-associated translation inhibitor RaiA [Planctomycetota bacterium]
MGDIKITARHIKITKDVKEYLQGKFDLLERYFDQIKHVEVILDHDKSKFVIEAIVSVVRGKKLVSKISDYNHMSAINSIVDKIEKQLVKLKEKTKQPHYHSAPSLKKDSGLEPEDWY